MAERTKFIQLVSSEDTLHALDAEGGVWYYFDGGRGNCYWIPITLCRQDELNPNAPPPFTIA